MVYPLLQCMLSDGIISQLMPRSPRHSPPLLRGSRREGRTEVARQPLSVIQALFCLVVSSNHPASSLYILVLGQHLLESLISRWIWGLFMLGYEMTPFEFPTPHPKVSLNGSNAYRSCRSQLYTPSLSWSSVHPIPPSRSSHLYYPGYRRALYYPGYRRALYYTAASHWLLASHRAVYKCPRCSLSVSNPLLPCRCPQFLLYVCFCLTRRFISTIFLDSTYVY